MKELNLGDAIIRLVPEQNSGVWTIPAQLQIENGFDEAYVDLDRDELDILIEALKELKHKH